MEPSPLYRCIRICLICKHGFANILHPELCIEYARARAALKIGTYSSTSGSCDWRSIAMEDDGHASCFVPLPRSHDVILVVPPTFYGPKTWTSDARLATLYIERLWRATLYIERMWRATDEWMWRATRDSLYRSTLYRDRFQLWGGCDRTPQAFQLNHRRANLYLKYIWNLLGIYFGVSTTQK